VMSLCHDRAFHRYFRGETGKPKPLGREIDLIAHAVTAPAPSRHPNRSNHVR
jgi:hypothetical protein